MLFPNFMSDVINGRGLQENFTWIKLEPVQRTFLSCLGSDHTFLYIYFQLAL